MDRERKALALRRAWERAIGKDQPRAALEALEQLAALEPHDPAWPHRKGDILRRLGRAAEAEEAFVAAIRAYVARGFFTRAAALAKSVVDANPARAEILIELDAAPARKLRDENRPQQSSILNPRLPPPPRTPSGTMPAALPPIIPREDPPEPADETFEEEERPSLVAGVPAGQVGVVASAMGLRPAMDSSTDEVRFEDVPDAFAVEVDLSEMESVIPPAPEPPGADAEVFEAEETPSALRLALMSGATLFADVPQDVMSELVSAAELLELGHGHVVYRRGEPANGLYVIAEGTAIVTPAGERPFAVTEGHVFGEDCLLEGAARGADARVQIRLLALRIPKEALDRAVKRRPAVGDVLFDLLVRRLVAGTLQASPLFAAFDVPVRRELARMFEVRRAAPGVVIKQRGKRSDGLYIAIAGEIEIDDGAATSTLPLGTMFGHASLLTDAPEKHTVRMRKEGVVLRLPATRLLAFAARFPKALAHLTELAQRPHAL